LFVGSPASKNSDWLFKLARVLRKKKSKLNRPCLIRG
jgi:hypothetical protein